MGTRPIAFRYPAAGPSPRAAGYPFITLDEEERHSPPPLRRVPVAEIQLYQCKPQNRACPTQRYFRVL